MLSKLSAQPSPARSPVWALSPTVRAQTFTHRSARHRSRTHTPALQYNAYGDVIEEFTSPVDGYVSTVATDPLREPGSVAVAINWLNPDAKCKDGCWDGA